MRLIGLVSVESLVDYFSFLRSNGHEYCRRDPVVLVAKDRSCDIGTALLGQSGHKAGEEA